MSRPVPPNAPKPPQSAAQKIAAQQSRKAPAAPPVYRPQPAPKVLQQKPAPGKPVNTHLNGAAPNAARTNFPHAPQAQSAAPKTFGVKPPNAAQPTHPHAAPPNQRAHVNPFKQPQTPPRVLQCKPAEAPRARVTPARQTPRPAQAHTQPRVLQPKTAGVVQLNKKKAKTKSRASLLRGSLATPIKNANRISARRDTDGRISNVRGAVRSGNKKGRKSTTGHKTTDTSGPINKFLRDANLLSKIVRMEGGHCIADVYGGSQCISNTVPLPHAFNTIAYKKEETALKKTLPTASDTTMEVSVEYPDDPLDGFLTKAEQNQLKARVNATQYAKLEALFSDVPDFMAWEVNTVNGHDWIEFRDIRKDIWPRATKPANVITQNFVNAVNNL